MKNDLVLTDGMDEGTEAHSSFNLTEILSAVFKHKGKIVFAAILGTIAAAIVFYLYPAVYESDAKLLVRYVLDRSAVDSIDGSTNSNASSGKSTENEAEILKSWDLAVQTAEAVGPKRLLPEAGENVSAVAAAGTIAAGLEVASSRTSDIIFVSYKNKEPQLATMVLQELVNRYFTKHLEVHRSAAAFDFVTQQSDQVRTRLNETEDALKALKAKTGILSVADNSTTLNADVVKLENEYEGAQMELAEQTARVKEIEQSLGATNSRAGTKPAGGKAMASPTPGHAAAAEQVQQYQALVTRLNALRQTRLELLSKFTPESQFVKLNEIEITNIDTQKRDLEKQFPDLIGQGGTGSSQPQQVDIASERTRLAGTQAKVEALKVRLDERIQQLSDAGSQIAALERKKELEETNYKYFQAALEKARIDETLDPSKIPNISAVQRPSPPRRVLGKRDKIVLALAGGGLMAGVALALLLELVLNRTIKRATDVENQLGIPAFLSIPLSAPMKRLDRPARKRRGDSELLNPQTNGGAGVASWEVGHFIRPYAEAIRDRLNLYFELNRMTHKPKLVGVTGFGEGAGTSTLASSLAATLSDMGEGKVLLVDMNMGVGHIHPFFEGRPAYSLATALERAETMNSASDNLYLATVSQPTAGPPGAGPMQLALKRFFDLMPNLKASDFDYIIFDMPPLNQTSPTLGMARFMDKVLLVIEAEKNHRDMVKRSYAELVSARGNVSVVFNKARSYLPKWLDGAS